MLKRTTCCSCGQLRALIKGQHKADVHQCARPLHRPTSRPSPVQYFTRAISTITESIDQRCDADDTSQIRQDEPKEEARTPKGHTHPNSRRGSDKSFVLTPRFRWRWRWDYPKIDTLGKTRKLVKGPKNGNKTATTVNGIDHFAPTRSEQQTDTLQSLMGSLGTMAEELRVPFSPLESRMRLREWKPKRQPTREERLRLAFNPWAMMLAGSIRLDAAARTRVPEKLLLEMGVVTNPTENSDYLVPDDLANLEAFDARLEKGSRRMAMTDLDRENGGSTIKILPYRQLVEEVTDELVSWQGPATGGRTKKGSVVKRLLPGRWTERIEKITAYQTASKDYWDLKERQGELDDNLFQRPKALPDLSTLKWQPNVAGRISSLMRQRLLLSIEHLGRKTDLPINKARKHFMCFRWPQSLYVDVVQEEQSSGRDVRPSLPALHYAMQDQVDSSEGQSLTPQVWEPEPATFHFSDPDIWLPGSFFLHIGPTDTALTALPYLRQNQVPFTGQLSNMSKFIPPMITVNNAHRLPVFNLQAVLGSDFESVLQQILANHEMVLPKSDDMAGPNYLILIRATAPGSHYIIQELWQLWRYIGGVDCLQPKISEITEAPSKAIARQREEMNAMKQYSMTRKAWNQFYKFLPGITRRSADT